MSSTSHLKTVLLSAVKVLEEVPADELLKAATALTGDYAYAAGILCVMRESDKSLSCVGTTDSGVAILALNPDYKELDNGEEV